MAVVGEVLALKAGEIEKGLVDRVDFHIGGELSEGAHNAAGHIAVEGVVGRVEYDAVFFDQVANLEDGHAHRDAEGLDFIGTGDDTAVVVAHNDNGVMLQTRIKDPLAGNVKIITVN